MMLIAVDNIVEDNVQSIRIYC